MFRVEKDQFGSKEIPAEALYGIHTLRAGENFPFGRPVAVELVRAFGIVKQACLQTCIELGCWKDDPQKSDAMISACVEVSQGLLDRHFVVDALQGGAGTSTNMNVNEVIANRACEILGLAAGTYERVHPLEDVNLYQSTNDTYPTALRLAAIKSIQVLEQRLVTLQESFQKKEKEFSHIVKVGRTEMRDAVLTTLGREMGAYAEAFNRDRWRVYKCVERLRVVNLGGTAIGTGLGAPRQYIFTVVDKLRDITGIGFARAENLFEATQNCDMFVEVSGMLKACAVSLYKVCSDIRFMSSGPEAGIGELKLPSRQAGSTIMPGKVNPVICEAVSQASIKVMANDVAITQAAAGGNLELNPFMPLIADCLLESILLLGNACDIFARLCVDGMEADEERCRSQVENSTVTATALVSKIGYQRAMQIAVEASQSGRTVRQCVIDSRQMNEKEFEELISPEAVCRLGSVFGKEA